MKKEPKFSEFKKFTVQKQFNWIVKNYSQDLYWVIRPIVKTHENADDVLQNTLLKIYRYLPKFKFESKIFTWAYRIAVNESINYLKKYVNKFDLENIDSILIDNLKSDSYYNEDEILIKLEEVILQLPSKQQEVFRLKYFSHLKYEEMSELLGTSVGSLKASYHIAVKKIKENILILNLFLILKSY